MGLNPNLAEGATDRLFLIGGLITSVILLGFYLFMLATRGFSALPSAVDTVLLVVLSAIIVTVGGVVFIIPSLFVLYNIAFIHRLTPLNFSFLSVFYEDLDQTAGQSTEDSNEPRNSLPNATGNQNKKVASKADASPEKSEIRENLHSQLDNINSYLDKIENASDSVGTEKLIDNLNSTNKAIEKVKKSTNQYSFPKLEQRTARLENRCSRIKIEITDKPESFTSAPDSIPPTPSVSLNYEAITVHDQIGKGGNADVYHATAMDSDKKINLAIKQPRISGTVHTETVEDMLSEAKTWQQIDDHDHVVSVIDYGGQPFPWIAMEYMDSGHLGDHAEQMSIKQSLWTAIMTTNAVRHAHRHGVVHLDLKPENILLQSAEDAWDIPKVADWGLSKHLLQHSKSIEGLSPQYAAPEQFDDSSASADDITDVYQLGRYFISYLLDAHRLKEKYSK